MGGEGRATAEVLKVGEDPESGVRQLALAAVTGALVKLGSSGLRLWSETAQTAAFAGKGIAYIGTNVSPALLSVGYIVGLNIATLVCVGGAISWFIAIPIYSALYLESDPMLSQMVADGAGATDVAFQIWTTQIRYMGVGAMLTGGVWALVSMRGSLVSGVRSGLHQMSARSTGAIDHTEQDAPMQLVLIGIAIFVVPIFFLYSNIHDSLGIGISFLGAFWAIPLFGVSLNMISMFAFLVVLGIVVDDAIVIGESAYTNMRAKGHSIDNILEGVFRVAMPATFGVLTTIAAFIPVLMISGVMGAFFASIGWVVTLCLVFSIIESKLILPAHLSHMKIKTYAKDTHNAFVRFQRFFSEGLHTVIDDYYLPFLKKSLERRATGLAGFARRPARSIGRPAAGCEPLEQQRITSQPDRAFHAYLQGRERQFGYQYGRAQPGRRLHYAGNTHCD